MALSQVRGRRPLRGCGALLPHVQAPHNRLVAQGGPRAAAAACAAHAGPPGRLRRPRRARGAGATPGGRWRRRQAAAARQWGQPSPRQRQGGPRRACGWWLASLQPAACSSVELGPAADARHAACHPPRRHALLAHAAAAPTRPRSRRRRRRPQAESDVQMLLASQAHLGTKNCTSSMERYVYRRRNDGIFVFNLQKTCARWRGRGAPGDAWGGGGDGCVAARSGEEGRSACQSGDAAATARRALACWRAVNRRRSGGAQRACRCLPPRRPPGTAATTPHAAPPRPPRSPCAPPQLREAAAGGAHHRGD